MTYKYNVVNWLGIRVFDFRLKRDMKILSAILEHEYQAKNINDDPAY